MTKATAAVVIPVYKNNLTYYDRLSLIQCLKILGDHPIIFISSDSFNLDAYRHLLAGKSYQLVRFDDRYFENIDGYNKLMLSPHFYKKFLNYKFILLYQLDAFVFKDELLYWCAQNYDYIGAPLTQAKKQPGQIPFLKGYSRLVEKANRYLKTNHQVSNVGNGGFSLRKTRSVYLLLKLLEKKAENWKTFNEDLFFKYWGNIFYPFFQLPSDETALKFSIETAPSESLARLNYILPFGCHAFEKYEPNTWKPFIPPEGSAFIS